MVRKVILLVAVALWAGVTPLLWARPPGQDFPQPYVTPLSLEEMTGKQGVLDTDQGTIIIDLLPEHAPNHVGLFIKLAEDGAYNGTIFHRVVRHGIIQGGDPLTKDPARADVYGRGGLGLIAAELSDERHTRGAVSAVVAPGQPDSGGASSSSALSTSQGSTATTRSWASVSEGMDVVTSISEGFCCNVWDHARESVGWTSLHGQSEHLVDQARLTDHVALRHPPRLPLAERMHYLDTADGPPRRGEPLEPQHRPGAAFDESMVLLDDVVQILALAERRTWSEKSLVFDGLERDRVSGVLVHVHDARGRRMRRTDRLAEKRDGRIPVARGPEQEIRRVTVGINAPVKIVPQAPPTRTYVSSIRYESVVRLRNGRHRLSISGA